jgi:GAF domain-containing protein
MPIADTYCARLLEGRLPNIVTNAGANQLLRDLELTRDAPIGAYIGIPLTGLDARLYVLCCLAHEQRPSLSERDLTLLRDLSETIIAALDSTSAR